MPRAHTHAAPAQVQKREREPQLADYSLLPLSSPLPLALFGGRSPAEAEAASAAAAFGGARVQGGVVRTNCLDCLNRTNMAQTAIGLYDLGGRLATLFGACAVPLDAALQSAVERAAQDVLRRMWQETGNAVSIQYTGTANLSQGSGLSESDQKKSLVGRATGLVEKGVRVANRYVQENFLEDSRQVGIDTLLMGGGAARRAPGLAVSRGTSGSELAPSQRPRRACALPNGNAPLSIFVGTWNVNGKFDAKTCSDEVRHTSHTGAWGGRLGRAPGAGAWGGSLGMVLGAGVGCLPCVGGPPAFTAAACSYEELHAWLAAPHAAAGGPAEAGADDVDMYVVGFQASSAVVCR